MTELLFSYPVLCLPFDMNSTHWPISPYPVDLPRKDLRRMVRLVRLLQKISGIRAYRNYIEKQLPACARFDPGHHSVMMGYDFHLCASGPKLIEVNTNAGGIWYANMSYRPEATEFSGAFGRKLLKTFIDDYALFLKDPGARPQCLVIVDEAPQQQPLYPEMQAFETMFRQAGIDAMIADSEAIMADDKGLLLDGKRIDMIYNRHCDFYLKTDAMRTIREAWLRGQVCLSPNPHTYGLLADKRRMILWSQPELMRGFGLNERELEMLSATIPETRLLKFLSAEEAWRTRKQRVFKPDTGYASRGVYVGEKLTRHKFAEFKPDDTLMQLRIAPSITHGKNSEQFKTDYRLFTYRERILGVSARIYQGQVTNLRTENGGFAKVRLID
ncbi:MAG: hypothetical protein ACXWUD_08295 [Methylosarcina sp.]